MPWGSKQYIGSSSIKYALFWGQQAPVSEDVLMSISPSCGNMENSINEELLLMQTVTKS